jgi:hypothetical protein
MKYEKPEVTALAPAIDAIQGVSGANKRDINEEDLPTKEESHPAYADWE